MANLSQNDHNIIREHSLNKYLNHLWDSLQKAEQDYKPHFILYDRTVDNLNSGPQKALSQLFNVLKGHEVVYNLHSKTEYEDVIFELFELFKHIWSSHYNYKHYHVLSWIVIKQTSDVDIWNIVFDLITTIFYTTPPTSIPVFYNDTSVTISSSFF